VEAIHSSEMLVTTCNPIRCHNCKRQSTRCTMDYSRQTVSMPTLCAKLNVTTWLVRIGTPLWLGWWHFLCCNCSTVCWFHHSFIFLSFPSGTYGPFLVSVITHILRYTVGLLDEWSARRRDLYLHGTTQHINTTDNHSCPERDSNPRTQQSSGRRPTP
jgi:hypothetical protein